MLCVILLASAGCLSPTTRTPSLALPRIENLLSVKPLHGDCVTARGLTVRCVMLLEADYERIVIELKTACLREGGTPERCGAEGK